MPERCTTENTTAAPDSWSGRRIRHSIGLVAASKLDARNPRIPIEASGRLHIF